MSGLPFTFPALLHPTRHVCLGEKGAWGQAAANRNLICSSIGPYASAAYPGHCDLQPTMAGLPRMHATHCSRVLQRLPCSPTTTPLGVACRK